VTPLGTNEATRNAIAALLAAGGAPVNSGMPGGADFGALQQPMDIVDPSDPAAYDSTLGDIVGSFPSPSINNPNNEIAPGDLPGMQPDQRTGEMLDDQGEPAALTQQQQADLEAAMNNLGFYAQPDPVADPDADPDAPAPDAPSPGFFGAPPSGFLGDPSDPGFGLGFHGNLAAPDQSQAPGYEGNAINSDVSNALSDISNAVNDAVSGYAVDQGFNADPGGFSAPGGLGDAAAAGMGIGIGLGAGLGEGAGLSGEAGGNSTGISSGPGGTGEGGAGGGDGGSGK
jgi:hypothetical protein